MKHELKAKIRWLITCVRDFCSSTRFAHHRDDTRCEFKFTLSQPFMPSATLEGKKHNLSEAASRINNVTILPGETFSFWHVVGNPNNARRFTYGRSLHAGKPVKDYGGGLCQASGIIHHAALIAGLDVMERHNHSVDLYTEATRFAPLGSDATVFFGYKDLRLRNNTGTPIRFRLRIGTDRFYLDVLSEQPLPQRQLQFVTKLRDNGDKIAEVLLSDGTVVSSSIYKPLVE